MLATRTTEDIVLGICLLPVAGAMIVYGTLELLAPSIPIRWQRRATLRAQGIKRVAGEAVATMVSGPNQPEEPWNDASTRKRVRYIGAFLLVLGLGLAALSLDKLIG